MDGASAAAFENWTDGAVWTRLARIVLLILLSLEVWYAFSVPRTLTTIVGFRRSSVEPLRFLCRLLGSDGSPSAAPFMLLLSSWL